MPITYRIDHAAHRVVLQITGAMDNDAITRCYALLFAEKDFVPGLDLLIDVRGSSDIPTAETIRERARQSKFLLEHFSGRVAQVFITNGVQFGMGRMYAMLAEMQGVTAGAFISIEEAEQWLREARSLGPDRSASRPW